ncbi:MAG: S-layer homology domain-containing protein [Firmicutes bacterium]|nr:S-layer homology domain-containing protein [Bacillota bacterium]
MLKRCITVMITALLLLPYGMSWAGAKTAGGLEITDLKYKGSSPIVVTVNDADYVQAEIVYGNEDGSGGVVGGGSKENSSLLYTSSDVFFTNSGSKHLPAFLAGQTYIKLISKAKDDKTYTGDDLLQFKTNRDITLYIAMETRTLTHLETNGNTSPVQGYARVESAGGSPVILYGSSNLTYHIYQKDYSAEDTVKIGGNAATNNESMHYVPIIVPKEGSAPEQPQTVISDSSAVDSKEDSASVEAINLLSALKIIDGGNFRLNEPITRRECAVIICSLLGLSEDAKSGMETGFTDVLVNDSASGCIRIASEMKIINGYGDGRFGPEDLMTYDQAVKALVCALGYEAYAQNKGVYPYGYLTAAAEIGVTKGVSPAMDGSLTRGVLAQLLYNSLNVDILTQSGFGETVRFTSEKGKNILTEIFDITKKTGMVTGIYNTTLTGASNLRKDEVAIDDEIYKIGGTKAKDYLGYRVIAYIRQNKNSDDKALVSILPERNKNEIVTLLADNIYKVTRSDNRNIQVEYSVDGDISAAVQTADIYFLADGIFNGKAQSLDIDDLQQFKSGKTVLIDNNNDGIYDVVIMESYETWVVNSVSELTAVITDKYRKNETLELDDGSSEYEMSIEKGGKQIKLSDLKEWDILSVAQSKDGKVKTVIVSNAKLQGSVTEKTDDDAVIINGKQYKIADNYNENIEIGAIGTFYLNVDGKIAAIDKQIITEGDYFGVLFKIGVGKGLGGVVELKIFTLDGEFASYKTTQQVIYNDQKLDSLALLNYLQMNADATGLPVDSNGNLIYFEDGRYIAEYTSVGNIVSRKLPVRGTPVSENPLTYNKIAKRQLLKYELNSKGEIRAIYTAGGSNKEDALVMRGRYFNEYTDEDRNNPIVKIPQDRTVYFKKDANSFYYHFTNDAGTGFLNNYPEKANYPVMFIDEDTRVICMSRTTFQDEKEYYIRNSSNAFLDESTYCLEAYGFANDKLFEPAKIILKYEFIKEDSSGSGDLLLVDKVTSVINEHDEQVYKLYGFINGKIYSWAGSTSIGRRLEDLKRGVLTQASVNYGELSGITDNITNNNGSGQYIFNPHLPKNSSVSPRKFYENQMIFYGARGGLRQMIIGDVVDVDARMAKICINSKYTVESGIAFVQEKTSCWDLSSPSLRVSVYDQINDTITLGTISDIQKNDIVVLRVKKDIPIQLFVYKLK